MHDVVSLFSGIGGLDCGLAQAGFRHRLLCESDGWRRSVLAHRFPGVPIWDDVRAVGVEPAAQTPHDGCSPEPDGVGRLHAGTVPTLVAGGSPCQDLSVAGNRAGLAGDRSGLFFEYARVVDAFRPRWLLFENVPGLFSSQGGRDFGAVLGTLADIGYGLAWRVLDSRYFGVPQRRRRVFIVGTLIDGDPRAAAERAGQVLAVGTRCDRHPATRGETREDLAGTLGGGAGERGWAQDVERMTFIPSVAPALVKRYGKGTDSDATDAMVVADTLTSGSRPGSNMHGRRREDDTNLVAYALKSQERNTSQGNGNYITGGFNHTGGGAKDTAWTEDATPPLDSSNNGIGLMAGQTVRRLTPTECERLQALPDGWTNPDGSAPDSRRYAGLGDAVTASVGEWIGRRILAAAQHGDGTATPSSVSGSTSGVVPSPEEKT